MPSGLRRVLETRRPNPFYEAAEAIRVFAVSRDILWKCFASLGTKRGPNVLCEKTVYGRDINKSCNGKRFNSIESRSSSTNNGHFGSRRSLLSLAAVGVQNIDFYSECLSSFSFLLFCSRGITLRSPAALGLSAADEMDISRSKRN